MLKEHAFVSYFQEEKQKEYAKIYDSYDRGLKTEVALKFRKGACDNCGSMTHKRRDCMERPRKIGAKFTGSSFEYRAHLHNVVMHVFADRS